MVFKKEWTCKFYVKYYLLIVHDLQNLCDKQRVSTRFETVINSKVVYVKQVIGLFFYKY